MEPRRIGQFTLLDVTAADGRMVTSNPTPAPYGPEQDDPAPMPTDAMGTDALDHSITNASMSSEESAGAPMALYVLGAAALAAIVYIILK
jgi:hypothetical protein